jgi:DNA-binding transcriptional MerR regulator
VPPIHPSDDRWLTRGQFAEAALLSVKALRIYEERGLLEPRWVDPGSGYRYYAADQTSTGRVVALLRGAGVPIADIGRIVHAGDRTVALTVVDDVAAEVDRRSRASQALLAQARIELMPSGHRDDLEVSVEVLADRLVLSVIDCVSAAELDAHMERRIRRLQSHARTHAVEVTAAPFGIFHAPVGNDSDGPLEVALPVSDLCPDTGPVRSYRTQGGEFATVEATGAEAAYPAVLTAYASAGSWIERRGHRRIGPPRELWQSDPATRTERLVVAIPFVRPRLSTPPPHQEGHDHH